jgi:hypothetical protein
MTFVCNIPMYALSLLTLLGATTALHGVLLKFTVLMAASLIGNLMSIAISSTSSRSIQKARRLIRGMMRVHALGMSDRLGTLFTRKIVWSDLEADAVKAMS